MAKFVISYIGGEQPKTPEEGQQHFAKYKQWLVSLSDVMVSPANPFKNTHTVSPDGEVSQGGQSKMSGYTIIEVGSMDEALAAANDVRFWRLAVLWKFLSKFR